MKVSLGLLVFVLVTASCTAGQSTAPTPSGEGWRIVAETADPTGEYDFFARSATDQGELMALLEEVGFDGDATEVDFDAEVVVVFAVWHGSGCRAPFSELRIDHEAGLMAAEFDHSVVPEACPANTEGYATFVAIERETLSAPQYTIADRSDRLPGLTLIPSDLE